QATPPPVTLHASDLKTHYDVQLPFAAWFYLNVLTFTTSPGELLAKLRVRAVAALERLQRRIAATHRHWAGFVADQEGVPEPRQRRGSVLTYEELRAEVALRLGEERVVAELAEAWEGVPPGADGRERSLRLCLHLWSLSQRQGPAVVLYYSPPYYPHVAA